MPTADSIIEVINYLLAMFAAVVSVGILRQVAGGLATSWRYVLIAFQVLALAELFGALGGLGLKELGGIGVNIFYNGASLIFVVLAIVGLRYQYLLLKNLAQRGGKR